MNTYCLASGDKVDQRTQIYTAVDVDETVEALKSGIDTVWENIRWLMDALEDVAMIHPFVAGERTSTLLGTKV